jgi:hypothetical protein
MRNSVTRRWATALHEASHSLIAISNGLRVKELVLEDNDLDGLCRFDSTGATAVQMIEVYLAGVLGERLGSPREMWLENACRRDRQEAANLSAGLKLDLDALVLKVRRRLASLWTEIDRLATALDNQGSLDEGEILCAIKTPASWLQMPPPAWLR